MRALTARSHERQAVRCCAIDVSLSPPDDFRMDYDAFRRVWNEELAQSRLLVFPSANETLDLRSMERSYSTFVEPAGGQGAEPFHVSAKLSWRWDALQTARAATTEDDMLGQLLGREQIDDVETERPWLRVGARSIATRPGRRPRASGARRRSTPP